MNSKTIFLLSALISGTANLTFGMETPPIVQRRAFSMPILDSHKSKLMADEDAMEQTEAPNILARFHSKHPSTADRILNQAKTSKSSKEDRSCTTCCKTFKIFLEILKQAAEEHSLQ